MTKLTGKNSFLGGHRYEIKQKSDVIPAMTIVGILTINDLFKLGTFAKTVQKNRPIIAIATKKATSQIRRCQKRFNVTGLIMPPN